MARNQNPQNSKDAYENVDFQMSNIIYYLQKEESDLESALIKSECLLGDVQKLIEVLKKEINSEG